MQNLVDQNLTKQHLKAAIFKSYILYVRKFHSSVDIEEICNDAGLPLSYLLNDSNWVSIEFEARFMEAIKTQVHDESFVFKVGNFGVTPEVVGRIIYYFCYKVVTLDLIYNQIPNITSFLNKVIEVKVVERGNHRITYHIVPKYHLLDRLEREKINARMPDFLENARGYYSAIPTQVGLPPAKVIYRSLNSVPGGYEMAVEYPQQILRIKAKEYPIAFAISLFTFFSLFSIAKFSLSLSVGSGIAALLLYLGNILFLRFRSISLVASEALENLAKKDEQYKALQETKINLQRKLQESNAIRKIVDTLIQAGGEDEIILRACRSLAETLSYDRSIIMLADQELKCLQYKGSYGVKENLRPILSSFKLNIEISSTDEKKISNVFRLNYPILIEDVSTHLKSLTDQESARLLSLSGSTSFMAVPIRSETNRFGVLIADCVSNDKSLTSDDLKILTLVGNQIAIALERERAQKNLLEALEKSKVLSNAYSKFVPLESLNFLGYKDVFDVKLGDGAEKNLSVLFSDIRDFSSLCETMLPSEALRFLNSYFGRISPIVKRHRGVVDKFIGDCIMGIFSNPTDALRAAVEIQRDLIAYNLERRIGGRRLVEAGIGICSGPVVVGPLGSQEKMEITVLSDAVNIASRLDGMCKTLKARILVSGMSSDLSLNRDGCFEIDHGELQVKGKDRFVRVIEIVDKNILSIANNFPKNSLTDEATKYLNKIRSEVDAKDLDYKENMKKRGRVA